MLKPGSASVLAPRKPAGPTDSADARLEQAQIGEPPVQNARLHMHGTIFA
jgi:hypothetical protein